MKKVSLSDIAKSLGVSKTLVSMVLNGHGDKNGISKDTQKRVHEKAKELNYKPNQIARGLRLGRSNTIGLIVADISNPFYARLARTIEDYASQLGYNVMFCSSDEKKDKEAKLIEMLKVRQVDGIILSATSEDNKEIIQLKKEGVPFVLIDRFIPRVDTNYVVVDNYSGAYNITNHLIKLGYQKIAMLTVSPSHVSTIRDRFNGYREALKDSNIRFSKSQVKEIPFNDITGGIRNAIKELLMPPNIINAIFTVNNNIAVACLDALNELNVKVPQDIALVSFDDVDLFKFCYPPVTAVAQPIDAIGRNAVEILIENIQSKDKHFTKKQIMLPTEIKVRRSCGSFFTNL